MAINNHLIIGLGGTGGRVLRALRKTIYAEFRPHKEPVEFERDAHGNRVDNGRVSPHPVKIDYLYIDSSNELMEQGDPSWKIPDGTLQLGPASQILIGGGNLGQVLDNLMAYPGINPWIGDRKSWERMLAGQINDALGGQKRRLGRFLFAAKGGDYSNIVEAKVGQLCEGGTRACAIHICAGLAGGTGSGTIIDAICLVRKKFTDPVKHPIFVYVLLPENNAGVRARANYYANGYAALKELNGLSVGAYRPYDITTGERFDFNRLTGNTSPFTGCYVTTNINETGRIAGLADPECEIHTILANFIYQKTVAVLDESWASQLDRVEKTENGDVNGNIGTVAEKLSGGAGAPPARSRQFLAFGMKRLEYPETEIEEYIRYTLARQAILQTLSGSWDASVGYRSGEGGVELRVRKDDDLRKLWRLQDGEFLLSLRDTGRGIQAIGEEWKDFVTDTKERIFRSQTDVKRWLWDLEQACHFYDHPDPAISLPGYLADEVRGFRGKGGEMYYNLASNKGGVNLDVRAHAKEIAKGIEGDMISRWRAGKLALVKADRAVGEAIEFVVEFQASCGGKIADLLKITGQTDDPVERGSLLDCFEKNKREWNKIGLLSDRFGKRKELIEAQAELLTAIGTAKTSRWAWEYAKALSGYLLEELKGVRMALQVLSDSLLKIVVGGKDASGNDLDSLDSKIAMRCREDETEDLARAMIKVYRAKVVREFVGALVCNQRIQDGQAGAFREAMCAGLGDEVSFRKMEKELTLFKIREIVDRYSDKQVELCHNQHVAETSSTPVLRQNILKCLEDRFPESNGLREFLHQVVKESNCYCEFDGAQENRGGDGGWSNTLHRWKSVILPKPGEHEERLKRLKVILNDQITNPSLPLGNRQTSIAFLQLANLFPLRYVKRVGELRGDFQTRIGKSDDGQPQMELFTEGDGMGWPDLFPMDGEEVRKLARPLMILAIFAGWIKAYDGSYGQDPGLQYQWQGRPNPDILGRDEEDVVEKSDAAFVDEIQRRIAAEIAKADTGRKFKTDLIEKIAGREQAVKDQYQNEMHPERKKQLEALFEAKKIIESL